MNPRQKVLTAAIASGAAMLVAAQLPITAQGNGKTVTMFAGPYSPLPQTSVGGQAARTSVALRELADRFEKQTGNKVQFIDPAINGADGNVDRDRWSAFIQSSIAAGNAPDVMYVPQGPDQSGKGWFRELDDLYAKPNPYIKDNKRWSDTFFPKVLDTKAGLGGKQYVLGYAANYPYIIIGTFYNKALMAKAGITNPPKNWEEWMKQLARIKAAKIEAIAPFAAESKTGSVWPMWSALIPAFTAHLNAKADLDKDGTVTQEENAKAVKSGLASMDDPHYQAAFLQYKRQLGYYLKGWNAADVPAAWNQGKVAQKYGGFWEIYGERSNTQRKFEWGFLPTLPVTKETSPLVTWTPKLAPTGKARLEGISGTAHDYAIIDSSVKRNQNLEAVAAWLQFISTPEANEFVINENPDTIPAIRGATPDPIWNQLSDLAVPDYTGAGVYPFSLDQEQQTNLQREIVLWALGQKNSSAFFAAVQKDMVRAADKFLAPKK